MIDLRLGDCLDVLASLDGDSVDAVVTDPPYGISFMGKHWDRFDIEERVGKRDVSHLGRLTGGVDDEGRKIRPRTASAYATPAGAAGGYDFSAKGNLAFQQSCEAWASECLRILKPGGHLVSFGGTRTYHRLAAGVEDAGFEIRDQLAWMFGSGFPKSLDVSKAIDWKLLGGRQAQGVGQSVDRGALDMGGATGKAKNGLKADWIENELQTPEAIAWDGWGTALKPGYEPIVLARKPLSGTVAATVMAHGTGALNIDGCRIDGDVPSTIQGQSATQGEIYGADQRDQREFVPNAGGRWPANVVLDEEAAAMLDAQTGILVSGPESDRGHRRSADAEAQRNAYGGFQGQEVTGVLYGDAGGASRFFYCAKVSADERHQGLAEPSLFTTDAPDRNAHPTVKPIELMRWLCRLVTPAGGLIVDPFLGSGTTGIAASLEGFRFLGIEREPDYMSIAEARISHWATRPVEAA